MHLTRRRLGSGVARGPDIAEDSSQAASDLPAEAANCLRNSGRSSAAAVVLFAAVVSALLIRTLLLVNIPGAPDPRRWALLDFRDALYYPIVSFFDGKNPYDIEQHTRLYPVGQPFLLYSPLTLVLHAPFALLPHSASQLAYWALTVCLSIVLAYFTQRMCAIQPTVCTVFGVAALILASRPGHWNLLLGQTSMELALAVYASLYFAERSPMTAGLGLVFATLKPTFGLPLVVLMAAQKQFRALKIGVGIASMGTLLVVTFLVKAAGGFLPLVATLWSGYLSVGTVFWSSPTLSPTRVDAVALIGRLLGFSPGPVIQGIVFVCVISAAALAVARVQRLSLGREADLYCIIICCLAILIASYQQVYSALLLVLPITAVASRRWTPPELYHPPFLRNVLLILFSIPAANYLSSFHAIDFLKPGEFLRLVWISVNAMSLLAAFLVLVILPFAGPKPHSKVPTSSIETHK